QMALATLQKNLEIAAIKVHKAVNDSILNYVKEYNSKKGYDAIFQKGATLYINPELDITADIVEGLNARYNKVKK
ncbi:MAG: OmpH family outer membrane protein, partial [Muribaculaceae bacterium]|nr:OmpH family outer membrane protein [Muribaculaceae bacterium]